MSYYITHSGLLYFNQDYIEENENVKNESVSQLELQAKKGDSFQPVSFLKVLICEEIGTSPPTP